MSLTQQTPTSDLRSHARRIGRRLCAEDNGQDLVEYAFLAAFIATAGMLALNAIGFSILDTYSDWLDPNAGVPSLWEPGTPSGS